MNNALGSWGPTQLEGTVPLEEAITFSVGLVSIGVGQIRRTGNDPNHFEDSTEYSIALSHCWFHQPVNLLYGLSGREVYSGL